MRLVLLATFGNGDGVLESGLVVPELQLGQRRVTSEEVQDTSNKGLLLAAQLNTRSDGGVAVDDVEVGGRHVACDDAGRRFEGSC